MRTRFPAALALAAVAFAAPLFAQTSTSHEDARRAERAQARRDHHAHREAAKYATGVDKKAYEAQAKADKSAAKALNTRSAKKAARRQDKADAATVKALTPQ